MKLAALAALAILAACATSEPRLTAGLNSYSGRPVADLIAVLGMPNSETEIQGQHAFIWTSSAIVGLPTYSSGGFTGPSLAQFDCTIRAFVSGDDQRVTYWDLQGNEGGCAPYARRFPSR